MDALNEAHPWRVSEMANVIIFGPPGIGKSTTIRRLARYLGDERAVDLEESRPRELLGKYGWDWMFCDGRMGGFNAIGGADLDPRAKYPGTVKVVLTLAEHDYQERRRLRDMMQPAKGEQPVQNVKDWAGIDDAVYMTADTNAVQRIYELMQRW